MSILLAILLILNISLTVYFIGVMYKRTDGSKRDIKAIADTMRHMEDAVQLYTVTYDFRIKVMEHKVLGGDDTGFNVEHLIKN